MDSTTTFTDTHNEMQSSSHVPNPDEEDSTKEIAADSSSATNFEQFEAPAINGEQNEDLPESGVGSEESSSNSGSEHEQDNQDGDEDIKTKGKFDKANIIECIHNWSKCGFIDISGEEFTNDSIMKKMGQATLTMRFSNEQEQSKKLASNDEYYSLHDIIPKYDLFDRFERAAGKWEFSIFMEPTELLQAAATLSKNHAGYSSESRNISISTDQSEERKIDYSTWRQHAESENPARREAAAKNFCRISNIFEKDGDEQRELFTFLESFLCDRPEIIRAVYGQVVGCAHFLKHCLLNETEPTHRQEKSLFYEQFIYCILAHLMRKILNHDAFQDVVLLEQLIEDDLLETTVIQNMVVPGLFHYLQRSDEVCLQFGRLRKRRQREARKNAMALIGDFPPLKNKSKSEEDLINSEEDDSYNSDFDENEPNEDWFLRRVVVFRILSCILTKATPIKWCKLTRQNAQWMRTNFLPHFIQYFTESQRMSILQTRHSRQIHEILAQTLAPLAKWMGTDGADAELLPVFQRFMRDNAEVQCAALKQLADFFTILSPKSREMLVHELSQMVTLDADTRSWRQRAQFADQLTHLIPLFSTELVNKYLCAFALTFAADRISEVRNNGISMLAAVLGAFISREWAIASEERLQIKSEQTSSECTLTGRDEPLRLPLSDKLLAEIRTGFLRTRNWRRRQSFGRLLYQLVQRQYVTEEQFNYLFYYDLMRLSDDDVSNVRQYFCLLTQLNKFDADGSVGVHNRLQKMTTEDPDLEIRHLAMIALGTLDPQESGLDITGRAERIA